MFLKIETNVAVISFFSCNILISIFILHFSDHFISDSSSHSILCQTPIIRAPTSRRNQQRHQFLLFCWLLRNQFPLFRLLPFQVISDDTDKMDGAEPLPPPLPEEDLPTGRLLDNVISDPRIKLPTAIVVKIMMTEEKTLTLEPLQEWQFPFRPPRRVSNEAEEGTVIPCKKGQEEIKFHPSLMAALSKMVLDGLESNENKEATNKVVQVPMSVYGIFLLNMFVYETTDNHPDTIVSCFEKTFERIQADQADYSDGFATDYNLEAWVMGKFCQALVDFFMIKRNLSIQNCDPIGAFIPYLNTTLARKHPYCVSLLMDTGSYFSPHRSNDSKMLNMRVKYECFKCMIATPDTFFEDHNCMRMAFGNVLFTLGRERVADLALDYIISKGGLPEFFQSRPDHLKSIRLRDLFSLVTKVGIANSKEEIRGCVNCWLSSQQWAAAMDESGQLIVSVADGSEWQSDMNQQAVSDDIQKIYTQIDRLEPAYFVQVDAATRANLMTWEYQRSKEWGMCIEGGNTTFALKNSLNSNVFQKPNSVIINMLDFLGSIEGETTVVH